MSYYNNGNHIQVEYIVKFIMYNIIVKLLVKQLLSFYAMQVI